jgi:hypothetical protein
MVLFGLLTGVSLGTLGVLVLREVLDAEDEEVLPAEEPKQESP